MNKTILFVLWGGLFALCAGLGFFAPSGWGLAMSLLFFLPPGVLVYRAGKAGDRHTVCLIRNLAALSLGATLVMLILNFVFAVKSQALGNFLHGVLVVVSTPMIASGYWVLSLFLWACLLMVCLKMQRKLP